MKPSALIQATELDGTPATDFFTLLNTSNEYSSGQTYNVACFAMLRSWLQSVYVKHGSNLGDDELGSETEGRSTGEYMS